MANLVPTQVEQLQRIGDHLRQVRQEQGLSLDILANQIFIRPALLQALETGREEQLPEAVFIQGFIRRYAEALGLDGKAISQEFVVSPPPMVPSPDLVTPAVSHRPAAPAPAPQSTPAPAPIPAPTPVAKAAQEPAPTSVVQPEPTPASEAARATAPSRPVSTVQNAPLTNPFPQAAAMAEERRSGGLSLWLALVGAVILIGGGLGLWLGRGSSPQTATPPVEEPTPTEPPPTAEAPVAAEPEPEPAALEAPIVVAVRLSERSWLSVVADGRTVYEGTSDEGYEETWTAENSLVFTTGNAGGVSLSFNGENPVVLGNSGAVRTLNLTPDSDAADLEAP
ncbi:MAG: helix-turn-helix domain-containing protein [Spirulina sp.]